MSLSTKTLNTRISLKYDTWSAWSNTTVADQGANLVLKRGEVAFCEVPSGASVDGIQNPPHILYKVGDGTKKFSELAWGSAKAADVHTWAKESQSEFENRVSALISAALTGDRISITGYVTESDFNAFKSDLENNTLKDMTDRLDTIEADYVTSTELTTDIDATREELIGNDADTTQDTIKAAKNAATAAQNTADQNKTLIDSIHTTIASLNDNFATDAEVEAIRSTLQGNIDAKVAQSVYNTKVQALEKADTDLAAKVTPLETKVNELVTASATHATKAELEVAVNTAVGMVKGTPADTADSESIEGAKKYADAKVAELVDGAPETLDTLNELAGALKYNADIVNVLNESIGFKASQSDLNAHTTSTENPHGVTAAQVDAYTKAQSEGMFAQIADLESGDLVVAEATNASTANFADDAGRAEIATTDAEGNTIHETYETKTNVNALATRVSTLEGLDEFIIDCGSSTTNIF